MNIRKNIDYSGMHEMLDKLMAQQLPQIELYCEIGKIVSQRAEKGAAVEAAAYLSNRYPNIQGFSPRNLRRMRDFYRTYENHPAMLAVAMHVGWTQNVVIMEAELPMELREWYLKATSQFGWTKVELIEKIKDNVYGTLVLMCDEKAYSTSDSEEVTDQTSTFCFTVLKKKVWHMMQRNVRWITFKNDERRRYAVLSDYVPMHMRC
ncbi:MAG: DUF1016 N-terminal domain-containing protein [Faecousia sp.]